MLKIVNDHREHHELTRVAGNQAVNVWYDHSGDTVSLEVGATVINMNTTHFFQMHEMMRKAAARLVMQVPVASAKKVEAGREQALAQQLEAA